ncbi:cupin domain-containing protein [Kribbella sp. NPDC055071]
MEPMSRVIVLDEQLPEALAVQRVEVRRITMQPGVAAGAHVHNGPVFGSIESGSVSYQQAGGAEQTLRAGDVFYEPAGIEITRFDALDEGVTFLAYFPLTPGQEPAITSP